MRKKNPFDIKLHPDEQEIEDALPDDLTGTFPVTANLTEEMAIAKEAAANYLRKDTKFNFKLSRHDADGLRRIALKKGLPYQALIASVLHQYIASH